MKKLFIPPVFVLLSLILIVLFYFVIPGYNVIPFPYNLFGIAVSFGGFIIMGQSRDRFKKHKTTLAIEKSTQLITEGIFSKTRNPMYIGMFLLLLGISVCFRNLFSIATPFGFLLLLHLAIIPKEEKLLLDVFGNNYIDYKNKVRRWI